MKLLRTRIENFRLLKKIEFDFATNSDQNLTVIRAANESGKTTLLTALQWGLFGENALPEGGSNYRISPLDELNGAEILVEIDYQILARAGNYRSYRLIRTAVETVEEGKWNRSIPNLNLLLLKPSGAEELEHPQSNINSDLPQHLREIFFTDGDRALSFIEGAKDDQKKRVESAIRSLLGLNVIERALTRVGRIRYDIQKNIRDELGLQSEIDVVTEKLSTLQDEIPQLETQLQSTEEKHLKLYNLADEQNSRLADALRRGNREEMEHQRDVAAKGRLSAEKDAERETHAHADLFRSELLGKQFLAKPFRNASSILNRLYDQGKIPSQTIPVLEDRLNQSTCICGESLNEDDTAGNKRREHIRHLIENSRNADEIQAKTTALFYGAQNLLKPVGDNTWTSEYHAVFERRENANQRIQKYGRDESEIEARIAELPDVDIQQLRVMRDRYRDQAENERDKAIRLKVELELRQREAKEIEMTLKKLLEKHEKGKEFQAELQVVDDLREVMEKALEKMKTKELMQVGQQMNNLFLNMIGADPSQKSIITRSAITPEYQIIVFGRHEQPLDPSQDLNGASRRALTIAFIMALAKVSEVEAPNVIDTPLGMTAGYVRSAMLQLSIQQSPQLVLFLTHDEIKGCEDILDEYAGQILTLTNPAHYPKILINDPKINDTRVLQCTCDHRNSCKICARREIASIEINSDAPQQQEL